METIDPRDLLVDVAKILERLRITYAVTGGMALFVWGRPRFTYDVDIIIKLDPDAIDRLARALRALHEYGYISEEAMHSAWLRKGEFNFIDGRSGIKVDFWVIKESPFEREQIARRIVRKIKGESVYFISPEDLVLSKLLWHAESESARQLDDVESVLRVQKKLDTAYLRKWARRHATSRILASLLKKSRGA